MNALIERARQGFEGFSSREQWMVALTGWFAIVALVVFLFLEPMAKSLSGLNRQIAQSEANTQDVLTLNQLKQAKLRVSPDKEQNQKLVSLKHELSELDSQMASKVAGLVTAPEMSALLESVLKQSDRLTLLSMRSLPPQKLTNDDESSYYIHPVEITLKGRYFDIVNYLSAVEALPVKYYWRNVNYRVTEYPWAEVTLQVYTLGESAQFIGGKHAFAH